MSLTCNISDSSKNKLDVKSLKCTFIGYGGDEFGYRCWDDQNKKIIRSRDVVFNGNVLYKDRDTLQSTSPKDPELVYFETDDVPDSVTVKTSMNPQEEEITRQVIEEPHDQVLMLRRSSQLHVPNRKYLSYLLLIDGGELECYNETCQVKDVSKWELAMKDEMKSLKSN